MCRRSDQAEGLGRDNGITYDTKMSQPQIVLDTNVLVSALRSRRGASYRLLQLIDAGQFEVNVSVALVLEYEEVCKRLLDEIPLSEQEVDDILDHVCRVSNHRSVAFLWRPLLRDPDDDMVLELAVASEAATIVTYNGADFAGAEQFGIQVRTPKEYLQAIGEIP